MRIALPISERDPDSSICTMDERVCFAVMELDEKSRITTIDFFDNSDDIYKRADIFVVQSPEEDVEELMEMGVKVLMAEFGATIEDIHEAYMFTQLRELG